MNAGKLRNKIEIQKIGTTQNAHGEVEEGDYIKFKDAWCEILPISGNEKFLSNTDFSKVTHRIRMRYLPGINASMRIFWNDGVSDRNFNFKFPRDIGSRNKEIILLAWEDVNG